uniref:Rho-GAP domain-containing protein n=1 Tax=Nothobranchius kadleci TaxID=1051664 RepID=A0A1A8BSG8_NOTKA
MLGQSVRLQPVPIQSLSELERARLQEVALYHLEEKDLDFKISIPTEIRKRRKSLRRRFDSFSKEKKERESASMAFGIPLSQAIANDQAYKRPSITGGGLSSPSSNSVAPAPVFDTPSKPQSPTFLDNTGRAQRRGGMSVDCISDLVESQSRLLEALQLSHPAELELKKSPSEGRTQTKLSLSLNPIYRQLDEEHSVHDVAALLKEFLRDIPDPLLPRELYPAFLHANFLRGADQLQYLQHLLYLLPPCNCDTLLRLLSMLQTVQSFAQDSIGTNDEEIPGNKMTAANLAVIFGPNLLQKERGGDISPQAMGIEDSTAIISVTLVLIQNYKRLITVSAPAAGDGRGREGSLTSEVFLNVLKLNQNRKRQEARYGEGHPRKSIHHMRQFHSHHNLLSLAQPSSSSSSSRLHGQEADPQDRQSTLSSALSFSLGGAGSCSSLSGSSEGGSIWVRQTPQEEGKASNFWDFFTGKGSGSETVV